MLFKTIFAWCVSGLQDYEAALKICPDGEQLKQDAENIRQIIQSSWWTPCNQELVICSLTHIPLFAQTVTFTVSVWPVTVT